MSNAVKQVLGERIKLFLSGIQTEHLERIREVYCEELDDALRTAKQERVVFKRRANSEFQYLRGVIYSQDLRSQADIDESRATHILKADKLINGVSTHVLQFCIRPQD